MMPLNERRSHPRKMGEGLAVVIGSRVYPLVDISVKGLSFQGNGYKMGQGVALKIAQLQDLTDNVEAQLTVVDTGDVVTRGKFFPTMDLMHFIVGHVSEISGVEPFYFK